jgi:hypothetical protein
VEEIGKSVDDRNRGVLRQFLHIGLRESADHDAVDVAGEHPGGVPDRLAAAELDVAGGEEERVGAELTGTDLERDAGPGTALGEDERHGLALKRAFGVFARLHPEGEVEERLALGARDIIKGEEIALSHAPPGRSRPDWQGGG